MDEEERYAGPERRHSTESRDAIAQAVAEEMARASEIEKKRAEAVARAVRDTNVERDLQEHGEHLREINGSQEKAVKSLAALEATLAGIVATLAAAKIQSAEDVERQERSDANRVSKRTFALAVIAAIAGYLSVLVAVLTQLP